MTYIVGTIGSAILLATIGPRLLGIDLPAACAEYERQLGGGGGGSAPGIVSAYTGIVVRAYRIDAGSKMISKPVRDLLPGLRVYVERVRRGDQIIEADADTVLQVGDVIALSGHRPVLVDEIEAKLGLPEVEDRKVLDMPTETVDVYVTSKEINGKTLRELSDAPLARGIFLRKIMRNMVEIPILPETEVLRGDILTITGSQRHVEIAIKALGYADRPVETTDIAFVCAGIVVGALLGALSHKAGGIPLSLSTSGGALLAGLVLGYLRTVHPTFGRIPGPALWLLNALGLNIFIAVAYAVGNVLLALWGTVIVALLS